MGCYVIETVDLAQFSRAAACAPEALVYVKGRNNYLAGFEQFGGKAL